MPKLSIIIPTFNSSRYIERCLQSVRIQTFRDYEIILQDGASSDDTTLTATGFRDANPGIDVKIFSEKDTGPYDAMNKGCRRASGGWLYFIGSDDELHDERVLSTVMGSPCLATCDVIYGNVQAAGDSGLGKSGSVYDGTFDLSKLLTRNICHQAIFYRAALVRRIGEYNTRYVAWADWDFNLRCWAKTEFRYVDMVVANFYAGGLSGRGVDECFSREVVFNVLRYFGPSDYDPLLNTANCTPDPTSTAEMRRWFETNELMFEQVETLLIRLGVRQEVIGAFLYPPWVLHSRRGLGAFGGSRLRAFRTEMRGLRREPLEPSLTHRLFKHVTVGTATLLLPPQLFYRIGHWYAQTNPGPFRKQLARAAKEQSKA